MGRWLPRAAAITALTLAIGSAASTRAPNEAGQIMVLMYHSIGDQEATWIRERRRFRRDLETLYEKGYRPISLRDLAQNRITTEAGRTPVVLTFDDGWPDNFRVLRKKGELRVDPESAVGILERFSLDHRDFPLEATFFVHGREPFGQGDLVAYKLDYLVSRGMDVGNHTLGHDNLALEKNRSPDRIQKAIGKEARFLESLLTGHPGYRVDLFALCNGGRPGNPRLSPYLASGMFEGVAYRNTAIVNVGGGPAPSPATRRFNPLAIPRVRASDLQSDSPGFEGWLRYFDQNPDKRYVSDGDPVTVTVPRALADQIDPGKLGSARLVVHDAP